MTNGLYVNRIRLNDLDRNDFHDKTSHLSANGIRNYNHYSQQNLCFLKIAMKILFTENIIEIDKYRALQKTLIELIKDIQAKKDGITDESELKNINEFLITSKVHLKYLKNILGYDKENITNIKNEIDLCKKQFKKSKSIKHITKQLNILNEYKEELQMFIQLGVFTDPKESQDLVDDLNDVIDLLEKNVLSLKKQRQKIEKIVFPPFIESEAVEQINYDEYKNESDSSEELETKEEKEILTKQENIGFPEIVCIVCGILLFIVIFLLIVSLIKITRKKNIVVETPE